MFHSNTNDNTAKKDLTAALSAHVGPYHIDIRRSQGSYSFLVDQNRPVLDMNQSLASRPLGYNHPAFNDPEYKDLVALYSANKMAYSTYYTTDFAKATDIIKTRYMVPAGFDRLFFIAGGAKSVEVAVHIAIINKVKRNIAAGKGEIGNTVISLFGGFHGRGLGLRSITTSVPEKNEHLPVFTNWSAIEPPKTDAEVPLAIQALHDKIMAIGPDHIACFLSEDGIQCGWGDRYIPSAFYDGVRKLANEFGFYVVNDAVQTGMYASGKPFVHQAIGAAQPDIIAGCKKSATGYVMVTNKILEVEGNAMDDGIAINSTFGGHLPDMITWATVLEVIERDNLIQNITDRGAQFRNGLVDLARDFSDLINPRGLGLMGLAVNVENGEVLRRITDTCLKNGLIIFPGTTPAPDGYAVRFRPVLDITESEVSDALHLLRKSLEDVFK